MRLILVAINIRPNRPRSGFRRGSPVWLPFIAAGLASLSIAQAQPITASNWTNHPSIKGIRAIYQEVLALKQQNKLRKTSKFFEYCPALDLERTLFTDAKGLVRFYRFSGGSDDSAASLEHTYNTSGGLRFVLVKADALNDTHVEYRYYLSATGAVLWMDERRQGQGYPFSNFRGLFAFNPKKAFAAPSPCR